MTEPTTFQMTEAIFSEKIHKLNLTKESRNKRARRKTIKLVNISLQLKKKN